MDDKDLEDDRDLETELTDLEIELEKMRARDAANKKPEQAKVDLTDWLGPVVCFGPLVAVAVWLAANAVGCPMKTKPKGRRNYSPAIERTYESQFGSERERLEFEAWDEGQQQLRRDSPSGGIRRNRPWD